MKEWCWYAWICIYYYYYYYLVIALASGLGNVWRINGCGSGRSYSPNQTTRRSSFNINEMSCTIRNKTELSMDVVCKEENYGMKEKHGIKDRERLVMNQWGRFSEKVLMVHRDTLVIVLWRLRSQTCYGTVT